ncbi:MAG: DUF6164 family protein [Mariprofundaceae bacterium]
MGVLLFKLRHVPDDEARDVRQLLNEHDIEFYETSAGNWGVSMPAIWLQNESRLSEARALLKHYQQQRQHKAQAEYERQKSCGEQRTALTLMIESPLKFILLLIALLFVLYISIMPFMHL